MIAALGGLALRAVCALVLARYISVVLACLALVPPARLASAVDALLTKLARLVHRASPRPVRDAGIEHRVQTDGGLVRVIDFAPSSAPRSTVLIAPDGPNCIEHHAATIEALRRDDPGMRVVCFDMPGFGMSLPAPSYGHSLDEGARVCEQVLDAMGVGAAIVSFSCANGLYAVRLAQRSPQRVCGLVLSQTPSIGAMARWSQRCIPWLLRVPVLGQIVAWLGRWFLARTWYGIALPRASPLVNGYYEQAHTCFKRGGCFCLASVVQALAREANRPLALAGDVPAVVLWGARDHSHRHTVAPDAIRELLPHAEVRQLAECGHFPDLEDPAAYLAAVRRVQAMPRTAPASRPAAAR